jgi:hypothetical protein
LEINFRPFIPDNIEHWQVFRDDEQILKFINNIDEFLNYKPNDKECATYGSRPPHGEGANPKDGHLMGVYSMPKELQI